MINEPRRGLDLDEARCSREYLLPTLRRLVDALHAVSPGKWATGQPLFKMNEQGSENPFDPGSSHSRCKRAGQS